LKSLPITDTSGRYASTKALRENFANVSREKKHSHVVLRLLGCSRVSALLEETKTNSPAVAAAGPRYASLSGVGPGRRRCLQAETTRHRSACQLCSPAALNPAADFDSL